MHTYFPSAIMSTYVPDLHGNYSCSHIRKYVDLESVHAIHIMKRKFRSAVVRYISCKNNP